MPAQEDEDKVAMHVEALGHAVLRVKDLKTSAPFYGNVLGLREVARYGENMAFFSIGGNHHDIALLEVGRYAPPPDPRSVGLYHLAFKVGDSLDDLRAWKARLESMDIQVLGMSDHKVSQALYIKDPDGIEIELYVDADPEIWRDDPTAVATVDPLDL
jgi:catechol 2,3-dioxygenase